MSNMRIDDLVAKYVQLRDTKAAMKKQFESKVAPLDDAMKKIEAVLLNASNTLGTDSFKTGSGTAYVSVKTSASIGDWDAYQNFLNTLPEEERWYYLDKRPAKSAIDQYREDHNDVPPGINWSERRTINVRR